MSKPAKETRETAEARFDRIQRTVTNETDAERLALRKKTALLKALRLEKEAAEREAEAAKPRSPGKASRRKQENPS